MNEAERIMLRDQIEYNEFCRRGQKQQKRSRACAGMSETPNGAKSHRPVDQAAPSLEEEGVRITHHGRW
jgi:hypothetical protein